VALLGVAVVVVEPAPLARMRSLRSSAEDMGGRPGSSNLASSGW